MSAPIPSQTEAKPPAGRPLRVLIVEDNEDAAYTLQLFLELEGHAVEVARDGHEGIAKAEGFRPDVVLCDIGLPGRDGYEVARAIRGHDDAGAVLVAVTGYATPGDVERAREAGFDHHVAKPASMEIVRRILARTAG